MKKVALFMAAVTLSSFSYADEESQKDWYCFASADTADFSRAHCGKGTEIWKLNGQGDLCGIPDGANVRFESPYNVKVGFVSPLSLGDVYINMPKELRFDQYNDTLIDEMTNFEKWGEGALYSANLWFSTSCDMYFYEGAVNIPTKYREKNGRRYSALGDPFVEHNVYFGPAMTNVSFNNIVQDITQKPLINITFDGADVGWLRDQGVRVFGDIVFTNAPSLRGAAGIMEFAWNGDWKICGEGKTTIKHNTNNTTAHMNYFNAYSGETFVIDVQDGATLEIGAFPINDYVDTNGVLRTRSSWKKTGSGTMYLDTGTSLSSYSGNIEIAGGHFIGTRVGSAGNIAFDNNAPMGSLRHSRTNFVHDAIFEMRGAGLFGLPNRHPPLVTTIISNATLICTNENGVQSFGNLICYNANLDLKVNNQWVMNPGPQISAAYAVSGLLKLDGNNGKAYELPGERNLIIGCFDNYSYDEETKTHSGNTELYVGELTGDSKVDAIFNGWFIQYPSDGDVRKYECGLRKTGPGVISLGIGYGTHDYKLPTQIDEGGIWLSNSVSLPTTTILNDGGCIGGTSGKGKVKDLVINEGGGFIVNATNVTQKITVNGNLTFPERGTLMLMDFEGDPQNLHITGIDVFPANVSAEDLAAFDPEKWSVILPGNRSASRHIVVSKVLEKNGSFKGKLAMDYKTSGFSVIVK